VEWTRDDQLWGITVLIGSALAAYASSGASAQAALVPNEKCAYISIPAAATAVLAVSQLGASHG
jgi:hypothetical protein